MDTIIFLALIAGLVAVEEFRISQLRKKCEYDSLTGLRNSHDLEAQILERMKKQSGKRRSCANCRETGSAVIVFIDIDYFKKVNDTLGHDAGNAILRILAEIIRDGDLVWRMYGDEFIMALFSMSRKAADGRIIEMRGRFERAVSDKFPNLGVSVSFSFGLSELPRGADADRLKDAIKEADGSMYVHKKARGMARDE